MAPLLLLSTESPRTSFNSMVGGSTHSILLDQAAAAAAMGSPMTRAPGGTAVGGLHGPPPRSSPSTGLLPPSPGSLRPIQQQLQAGGVSQSQSQSSMQAGMDSQQWEEGGGGGGGSGGYANRSGSSLSMAAGASTAVVGSVSLNELEMQRRLKETQALLSRFSEENGRLAKENDKLVRTRTVRVAASTGSSE